MAEYAGAKLETARSFIQRSQVVERADRPRRASGRSGGRPPELYRVRAEALPRLRRELTELRRDIDPPPAARDDVFATLDLLDESLCEAEQADPRRQPVLMEEALLDIRSVTSDLAALRRTGSPHIPEFERRLAEAEGRLGALRSASGKPPLSAPIPAGAYKTGKNSLIKDLVAYERSLKKLRAVFIVSDRPSRPEGAMGDMMRQKIKEGVSYYFILPRTLDNALKSIKDEYIEFRSTIFPDGRKDDARFGDIELREYSAPKTGLRHMIFYQFTDGQGLQLLIRLGDDAKSHAHLRVDNHDITDVIYSLINHTASARTEPATAVEPLPDENTKPGLPGEPVGIGGRQDVVVAFPRARNGHANVH